MSSLVPAALCILMLADPLGKGSQSGPVLSAPKPQKVAGVLTITVGDGSKVLLRDVVSEETDATDYDYVDYLPRLRQHLVRVSYYEGHQYLLVDEHTGRKTVIDEKPVISPDGKRFAYARLDSEAGIARVDIWLVATDSIRLEYRRDSEGSPGAVEWLAANALRVDLLESDDITAKVVGHELFRLGQVLPLTSDERLGPDLAQAA